MRLTFEERQYLKREIDKAKRSAASTYEGVCMGCLEPMPEEKLATRATYCSATCRKRHGDRVRKLKLKGIGSYGNQNRIKAANKERSEAQKVAARNWRKTISTGKAPEAASG